MAKIFDRVKFNVSGTPNQGTCTVGTRTGANFYLPSEAGANSQKVFYLLLNSSNDEEHGIGTVASDGSTVTRDRVISSIIGAVSGTTKINVGASSVMGFTSAAEAFKTLRGVRAVTAATDTILDVDGGAAINYNRATAIAVAIAQAGGSNLFNEGWYVRVRNDGDGTVTITPTTSTINGIATLALTRGQGALIYSDGTNYTAMIAQDKISTHGADIASAATLNLEAATGDLVDVTGNATITAITLGDGHGRTVRFTDGGATLVGSGSLNLQTGISGVATSPNDIVIFRGYAGGIVKCISYTRVNGEPIAGASPRVANNLSDLTAKYTATDNLSIHGADIASASTLNLETATGNFVHVTGTTGITAITLSDGHERTLYFTGVLTITASGSLILPNGAASLTTQAGDIATVVSDGGTVRFTGYGSVNLLGIASLNQVVSYGASQSLSTTQRAQARANISAALRGHLFGVTLSAAGSTTTFGVAAGEVADSTNVDLMVLASAYTKTASTWAVGTTNGALDTGAIAASTWYHVFIIKRPDTGVVDILLSLSATAPTMPTNYTLFRRIGSMKTDGSSQWVKFSQLGDEFLWDTVVTDINVANPGTSAVSRTLTVPTGVQVISVGNYQLIQPSQQDARMAITSLDKSAELIATVGAVFTANGGNISGMVNVRTNTSAQIRTQVVASDASTALSSRTYGWFDSRGRLN